MTGSQRGRWALIARGVLVLAAVLLLPLAAMLQAPRESAAQSAGQDSLWAGTGGSIGVCADPSSPASLSGCFASATTTWSSGVVISVATDGVNVYFASQLYGGLSCPIADLGANCTRIMAGPWGSDKGKEVWTLAAANGQIWIGQGTGEIYRCPANLPYVQQDTAPSQCVLLDDAGNRGVHSLLLANGRLYAGLSYAGTGAEQKKQGLLWSCSPDTVNACSTLDSYGDTIAYSLVAGGGYLWAGLENGIIWRCDLNAANACDTWEKSGGQVKSISYDGQGTLYAAIDANNGVVWSCPTAYANGCSSVLSGVTSWSVAAGAGSVFSSTYTKGMYFGSSPFIAAGNVTGSTWMSSVLLYLPADGPAGVGAAKVKMSAKSLSQKIEKRCAKPGKTARATVIVTGPNGFERTLKTGVCGVLNGGIAKETLDLLDPGQYTVKATAGNRSGKASFTIEQDLTRPVNVKLKRSSTGG
jgi:hypothetical protein